MSQKSQSVVFQETDVLESFLSDISSTYTEKTVDIRVWSSDSDLIPRSPYKMNETLYLKTQIRGEVGRPLKGPNKLRYIIDDMSHIMEHWNCTDFSQLLRQIKKQENDSAIVVASVVYSLLEDQFVDTNRVKRFRGHRKSIAFKRALYMRGDMRPPLNEVSSDVAIIEGFTQLATAGYVKNPSALEKSELIVLNWLKSKIREVRHERELDKRLEVYDEITSTLCQELLSSKKRSFRVREHILENPPPSHEFKVYLEELEVDEEPNKIRFEALRDLIEKIKELLNRGNSSPNSRGNKKSEMMPEKINEEHINTDDNSIQKQKTSKDESETKSIDEEELIERLEESSAEEMFDADGDEKNIFRPTDDEKEQFGRLQNSVRKEKLSDIEDRKKSRDEEISRGDGETASKVKQKVQSSEFVDELIKALRSVKTRQARKESTKGSRINKRAVSRHMSGDYSEQRLYSKQEVIEIGNKSVGVAVDLSGSMDETEALKSIGCLSMAVNEMDDDFTASYFSGRDSKLITGPNENFEWEHFSSVDGGGKTPTAKGIFDVHCLLDEITEREKILFVITDGKPNISLSESGQSPVEDAKEQVRKCREDNIRVIGLGLSNVSAKKMKEIFGESSYINVENESDLSRELLKAYKKQIGIEKPASIRN